MSVSRAVSSKEVLDYLGFRDSKFMHAAFQLLGEPWDGSRMDFGETVKCIAQFCMRARGVPRRFHFTDTTRGHLTSMSVVSFSSLDRVRRGAFMKMASSRDAACRFGKDELLHFAYQIFDADDNGWISHEEFILLLSDLHPSTNRGRTTTGAPRNRLTGRRQVRILGVPRVE